MAKRLSVDDALAVLFSATQRKRLNAIARPSYGSWIPRSALLDEALTDLFAKYERGAAWQERFTQHRQGQQARLEERFAGGRADAPYGGAFGPHDRFELRAVDAAENCEYILRQRRASGGYYYIQINVNQARVFRQRQGGIETRRRRLQELHPDKLGREQTPEERQEYTELARQRKRRR